MHDPYEPQSEAEIDALLAECWDEVPEPRELPREALDTLEREG